jgi:hypothetical protein
MLNSVNHFFVGQANQGISGTYNTAEQASPGDIGLFLPTSDEILLVASIADAKKGFRIGQKTKSIAGEAGVWRYSPVITNDAIRKAMGDYSSAIAHPIGSAITLGDIMTAYTAPVAKKVVINCTAGASVTAGNTVYLEIVYKNVRDLSPQFRYDLYQCTIGGAITTVPNVLTNLKGQIDKDPMAMGKLTATVAASTLTIEAKFPPYSANQRYEWQSIDFEASLSYTEPNTSIANTPASRMKWGGDPVASGGNDGVGYYPVVSDQEKRALAYQGITNWTAFPVYLPDMYAKPELKYDCIRIPFATQYRSADNISGKLTNQLLTIYLDHPSAGGDPKTSAEAFENNLVTACNY